MKRKLAIIAAAALLTACVGCSFSFSDSNDDALMSEAQDAELMSSLDDDIMIDVSAAKTAYDDAFTKTQSANNFTVDHNTHTVLGPTDGSSAAATTTEAATGNVGTQGTDTSINVAEKEETVAKTFVKKNVTDSVSKASFELTNDYEGSSSSVTGYYDGSILYYGMDVDYASDVPEDEKIESGQKYKEAMSFDDFWSVVNVYDLTLYSEDVSSAACLENKDGSKKYYFSYDPAKLVSTMTANMEAQGGALPEGQTMTVNYSNIIANIDKDGYLTSYAFVIDAFYQTDDGKTPYSYSVSCSFSDFGTTVVDEISKDKLEEYTDPNDVTDEVTEDASGDAAQSEAITEIVTEAFDPNAIDPNAK